MGFFRYRQHEATKNGFNSAFLYNKIAIFVSSKNYTRMEQNWKDKIANLWRKQRLSLRDERIMSESFAREPMYIAASAYWASPQLSPMRLILAHSSFLAPPNQG